MNPPLTTHLASRIRQEGPLPFHAFMEEALYHPEHGFYSSGQTRTGPAGDFLTPVSPGPVLGELLATQACELHAALQKPHRIRFIEQGADAGWLARDLSVAMRNHHPDLAHAAEFHFIEPHSRLAAKQQACLHKAGINARWHSSWETIPDDSMPSFFYSCELVDSFPVRIFQRRNRTWWEKYVGLEKHDFVWKEVAVDPAALAKIRHWKLPEVEGFTAELRPGVPAWVSGWSQKISKGLSLTLDYGGPATELFSPARSSGTLVALRNHQRSASPLTDPGQLDLSAHVNFTELEESANRKGWKNYGQTDFSRGLTFLASPLFEKGGEFPETWIRNFRHLTHPSFFGLTHKILVQGKSLPPFFIPSVVMKV